MSLLTAVGAIGRLLSSYPTVKYVCANSHPKSGASIYFSDSVIVPDSSVTTEKVADGFGLTLYKESQSELTPLEFITSPTFINKKETLSVSESIQISIIISAINGIYEFKE